MSRDSIHVSVSVCAVAIAASISLAGPLTPPAGPVTSTMKTIEEVEPRIAINPTNTPGDADSIARITQSGSYYLTGDITGDAFKHAIQIEASGVTLDLNGFTLFGVANSLDGINMPGFEENVVIRDGQIRGWGGNGVSSRIDVGRIERIVTVDNGGWGIDNSAGGTFSSYIDTCVANGNGGVIAGTGGIRGGTTSVVTDCLVFANTGRGIQVSVGSTVRSCYLDDNSDVGVYASNACTVSGCTVHFNGGDGIRVGSDCQVFDNNCDGNGDAGIHVTSSDTRVESNNCTGANRGIDVDASGNFIARNTCSGNTANWDVVAGNICLVVNATASAAILGNSGGVSPGSTDPNANFTY